MKNWLILLLIAGTNTNIFSQEIPDTTGLLKTLIENGADRTKTDNSDSKKNNKYEKDKPQTKQSEFNKVSVTLISIGTDIEIPISNGQVLSYPPNGKTTKSLTNDYGIGVLELRPGSYTIYGEKTGYEKGERLIDNNTTSIKIFMSPTHKLKGELAHLLKLVESDQTDKAMEILKELKSMYPNNNDLNYIQRKYGLD